MIDRLSRLRQVVNWLMFIKSVNQKELSELIGVNKSYLSQILNGSTTLTNNFLNKLYNVDNRINIDWIISGNGRMTEDYTHPPTHIEDDKIPLSEPTELPVIPSNIVNEPQIDIFQYLIDNKTDRSPVVQQFPESAAYYRIKTRSMEPYICPGDMLALSPYPVGAEKIVPGDPYVVDTLTNGLVTRILYNHPDGYLARTYNNDRFTDFVINREDIIRIFRIVGLIRTNVQ